jgi:transcription antitermination factor NusG
MANELWYALQVRPRFDKQVSANLRAKGYELLLPLYKRKSHWSDRIKTLEAPLFPGYLFCHFDVGKRLPILQAPGVTSVVGIGKCPEPIDEKEIEAIRTIMSSGVTYQPHPYLTVGDCVRVEHGALAGLVGLITLVKNDFRLIISVNLLMRSVSVEIDRSWVDPIRPPTRDRFIAEVPLKGPVPALQNELDWRARRIV